jgi:hypothetical protein
MKSKKKIARGTVWVPKGCEKSKDGFINLLHHTFHSPSKMDGDYIQVLVTVEEI